MRKIFQGKIPAFQFHLFQKFSDDLDHAVFSRHGGVSKAPFDSLNVGFHTNDDREMVNKNRSLICSALKLEPKNLFSAHQTHSKNIFVVKQEHVDQHLPNQETEDIDAFITNIPEVGLMAQVADCQAILMFDPVKKVIAAIHAGWKGQVLDVSGNTVTAMKEQFGVDPRNIIVGISPSLGPCCSFFSDPKNELPPDFKPFILHNKCVDLWEFSFQQLQKSGIEAEHIELARVCSFCGGNGEKAQPLNGTEKFFSFRRDRGITGRFGVVIALKQSSI